MNDKSPLIFETKGKRIREGKWTKEKRGIVGGEVEKELRVNVLPDLCMSKLSPALGVALSGMPHPICGRW
jgi:hypothetical protein